MIDQRDRERVVSALPFLARFGPELNRDFLGRASLARFGAGRDVMAEGDRVDAIPLVISGTIRVFKIGESGREITLYRFGPGECCVLCADSILGNRLFPACARVREAVEAALVPAGVFDDWLARSAAWRGFVFGAMSRRLVSLMDTLDDVAFGRMDARVAGLLLERANRQKLAVAITHQEIADELGSSREVISRILEEFQSRGLTVLSRGQVEIVDPQSLSKAALL